MKLAEYNSYEKNQLCDSKMINSNFEFETILTNLVVYYNEIES